MREYVCACAHVRVQGTWLGAEVEKMPRKVINRERIGVKWAAADFNDQLALPTFADYAPVDWSRGHLPSCKYAVLGADISNCECPRLLPTSHVPWDWFVHKEQTSPNFGTYTKILCSPLYMSSHR